MRREESLGGWTAEGKRSGAADKLLSVFCEIFRIRPEKVHPELGPQDIQQWDSIGHMMLVAAIEQTFSIQLDTDEIIEMTSFGTSLAVIEKKRPST
ncbi:MAG: acyl carrier protein [Candidatus Binatia bacterium]